MNKKFLFVPIFFFVLSAVNGWCFTVSPNRVEIAVAPSQGYSGVLNVKSTGKGSVDIKVRAENWIKTPQDLNWLQIEPLAFELKEGETKEITFRVDIPKKAKGEVGAMVFVEGRPREREKAAITINTSIGVPIYAAVKGTEKYKAEIVSAEVLSSAPLKLAVKIRNLGNVHVRPTGTVYIKTKSGKEAFTVQLNEYNYPILPNSSRILEIRSDGRLEPGDYVADIKMGFADKTYRKKIEIKTR